MLAISRWSAAAAALVGHGMVSCRFADRVRGVMLQGGERSMDAADRPPPSSLNKPSRKDPTGKQDMGSMPMIDLVRRTHDGVSWTT